MIKDKTQSALWTKLASFQIDEGNESLTFAKRLARENEWSLSFAERVLDEYRRFLFLCAAAGHPCTPSEQVDEAWHLHLCYTRSYWEKLCGEILPAPLHHNPTKGGQAEGTKFDDWYRRTLESYRAFFDSEPPSDIWPSPEERFAHRPKSEPDAWVIPKRPVKLSLQALSLLILAAIVVGCSSGLDTAASLIFLIFVGGGLLILGWVVYSGIKNGATRNPGTGHTGCSAGVHGCGSNDSSSDASGCGSSGCGSGCGGGCGGGCGS